MKIPNKMKYIEIKKFGPAEGLKLSETEVPNISKNEVLIIGGGESVKRYKNFIESYIKKNKQYILFCNVNKYIDNNIPISDARSFLSIILSIKPQSKTF